MQSFRTATYRRDRFWDFIQTKILPSCRAEVRPGLLSPRPTAGRFGSPGAGNRAFPCPAVPTSRTREYPTHVLGSPLRYRWKGRECHVTDHTCTKRHAELLGNFNPFTKSENAS